MLNLFRTIKRRELFLGDFNYIPLTLICVRTLVNRFLSFKVDAGHD